MHKTQTEANWACHVRNLTGNAVPLSIPFGVLENQPRMTADQHRRLRQQNRERIAGRPAPPPTDIQPVETARPTPAADPARAVDKWQ
jgi:hypothetical protein